LYKSVSWKSPKLISGLSVKGIKFNNFRVYF